ncbi:MAG: (d)CMP kinase [Deltaproteobacteria bacterium]|nr:(d)CMP kinase [Deltaproteobacteria bacterium]
MMSAIITIDGPVGSGKSTIGRLLAKKLGYVYLDTGAMYRVIALESRERGIAAGDEQALAALSGTIDIQFKQTEDRQLVFSSGRDVTDAIRTPDISMLASRISALGSVRSALVGLQRQIGCHGGIVIDGRDAGTVIFPHARFKFYLDATVEIRAQRRYKEFIEKKINIDYNSLFLDIQKRDHDDSTRSIAPLKPAPDAAIIDTTEMTLEDVLEAIVTHIALNEQASLP